MTKEKSSLWYPYIRGTSRKYGKNGNGGFWGPNGFNCIEAGYIKLDDDNKVIDKVELTPCSDVVRFGGSITDFLHERSIDVSMDCVDRGYLRLFSGYPEKRLKWESERIPLSDMRIIYGTPLEEDNV